MWLGEKITLGFVVAFAMLLVVNILARHSIEQTQNSLWLLDLCNVVAVMLAILAVFAIRRDVKKRRYAQGLLQAAHDALEQRVQERTAELTQLNTTLVQVNATLRESAQAQEHARKENALLARYNQLLLESVGEGIYSIDAQGCCTFLNQRGAQMLGVTPAEVLGTSLSTLSVAISSTVSSIFTGSPGCLCHLSIVASMILSPSFGITRSTRAMFFLI